MFKKYKKRSSNPLFVIFRLILSIVMFGLLLGGAYTAYKHFSGLDPLKLDPQSILKQLIGTKTPPELLGVLSALKIDPKIIPSTNREQGQTTNNVAPTNTGKVAFKFMLMADSHSDNANLKKAIAQAKEKYPDLSFIIGLGDYTNVGTIDELKKAKAEFDLSGFRYFLIAGDHDLWDSRDKGNQAAANFKQVFGPLYQSFTFNNFKFLLLDNSDNYAGLGQEQQDWINSELEKAEGNMGIFAFIHEPLYHPSSDRFMGKVEKNLKVEAQSLIYQLKNAGVKKVFSGDIHYFSEYEEPTTKLEMVTVGAVLTERNPQVPRFAIGYVFEDGSIKVEDVEIR